MAPDASEAKLHSTRPALEVPPPVADTKLVPLGTALLSTTGTLPVPTFAAFNVYVSVAPGATRLGTLLTVRLRWLVLLTKIVDVAETAPNTLADASANKIVPSGGGGYVTELSTATLNCSNVLA